MLFRKKFRIRFHRRFFHEAACQDKATKGFPESNLKRFAMQIHYTFYVIAFFIRVNLVGYVHLTEIR